MKEIKVKELKRGDVFVENDDYRYRNYRHVYTKIVEVLRIIEENNLAYVRFKFIDDEGIIHCRADIYNMDFNVCRLPI